MSPLPSPADPQLAFDDGVAVALLAAVARTDDVPLAIADALGVSIQGARPVTDQLLDGLRERALLLVLDNLEHLLGRWRGRYADSALIGRILAEAPGVYLLATSRERLRVRDEWVLELGGLALPTADSGPRVDQADAVRLFVERAQRIAPGFSLSGEGRAAVARICRRLEGMPLAIELAAAWAHVLAPARDRRRGRARAGLPDPHRPRCALAPPQHARGPRSFLAPARRCRAPHPGAHDGVPRRMPARGGRRPWRAPRCRCWWHCSTNR